MSGLLKHLESAFKKQEVAMRTFIQEVAGDMDQLDRRLKELEKVVYICVSQLTEKQMKDGAKKYEQEMKKAVDDQGSKPSKLPKSN